jgi:rRNA maturation protein Rpf1
MTLVRLIFLLYQEVRLLFPNAQRINRGQTKINELVDVCRSNGFSDLVIVHEVRSRSRFLCIRDENELHPISNVLA